MSAGEDREVRRGVETVLLGLLAALGTVEFLVFWGVKLGLPVLAWFFGLPASGSPVRVVWRLGHALLGPLWP